MERAKSLSNCNAKLMKWVDLLAAECITYSNGTVVRKTGFHTIMKWTLLHYRKALKIWTNCILSTLSGAWVFECTYWTVCTCVFGLIAKGSRVESSRVEMKTNSNNSNSTNHLFLRVHFRSQIKWHKMWVWRRGDKTRIETWPSIFKTTQRNK